MPMPGDPVTNERLETVLLGIATQIASGMAEMKSEMSGLINEAELRWQAKLAEQSKGDPYYGSPGVAQPESTQTLRPFAKSLHRATRLSRAHCVHRTPS